MTRVVLDGGHAGQEKIRVIGLEALVRAAVQRRGQGVRLARRLRARTR